MIFFGFKIKKIKEKCFYWIDAQKITNYLGKQITKNRPSLCIYIKNINHEKYYYFLLGTSKSKKEIRSKNFTNYFVNIKKTNINNLIENTNFQSNTIYTISEKNLEQFFSDNHFIGKIDKEDWNSVKKSIKLTFNDEVGIQSFFSSTYLRWVLFQHGKNFIYIGSRHHKSKIKNILNTSIKKNIKDSSILVKNINNSNNQLMNKLKFDVKDFNKK
ncbi:MAG: type II toxin-antitoxin system PemK/MazF family toxin [Malacoplasma sp.]|nr:type II toxin-antitoxin system PemK/MazF family toxin [Malacoplasma sp.]